MMVMLTLGLILVAVTVALAVAMYRRDDSFLGVAALTTMIAAGIATAVYAGVASS